MFLVILAVTVLARSCHGSIGTATFGEVFQCILASKYSDFQIAETQVNTRIACAVACSTHAQCESLRLSRDAPFTCTLFNRTQQSQTCDQYTMTTYRMYDNLNSPCRNGGVRVPGSGNCTCFGGYVGLRCERLMLALFMFGNRRKSEGARSGGYDCADGKDWGFLPPDNVAMIHPNGSPKPFLVFCEENPWDTRTYIMARSPGTLDFYRDWAAYKGGFGDLDGEFWLGLDNVHYLTNSLSQNLIAEVHTKMPSNIYLYRQRTYSMFTVGAESTGYVMSFAYNWETAPPHDIGDCLTPMKGKKFSTFDVDNDDDPERNCAAVHQGAWWFTACGECNPTGPLTRPNDGYLFNVPNETFWYPGIPNYSLLQVKLFLIRH